MFQTARQLRRCARISRILVSYREPFSVAFSVFIAFQRFVLFVLFKLLVDKKPSILIFFRDLFRISLVETFCLTFSGFATLTFAPKILSLDF